jgi:dienelactone hydrolase
MRTGQERSNPIAGLPTALNRIPVEILERARAWLRARPEADVQRLGVVGASKGGEFALVLASIYDWIGAVVAFVPSDTVWQGSAAGHGIVGSGWRPTTMHNTGVFNDGGTPEADARAQADAWTKMLAFLSEQLFVRPRSIQQRAR